MFLKRVLKSINIIKKESDFSAIKGLFSLAQKHYTQLQVESSSCPLSWIAKCLSWALADRWLFW